MAPHDPVHPDLRLAACFLPRRVVRPWLTPVLQRIPIPSPGLPKGVTARTVALPATTATARVVAAAGSAGRRPVLLWIHGGGYVIGDAAQDDGVVGLFVERLGVTVVSVNYRLAPQQPFPAGLDDCVAAYDLIQREAEALALDPARVVIGGASAGGGLAAALALRLYDTGRPAPLLQVLVFPMLDDRTATRPADGLDVRLWDPASNHYGWTAYLGRAPGSADITDHMAPARRDDLSGLPPAWIGVGTLDLFHDEDVTYARRLREAGVPTTLEVVPGAFHGFHQVVPWAAVSRAFVDAQVQAIADALAAPGLSAR